MSEPTAVLPPEPQKPAGRSRRVVLLLVAAVVVIVLAGGAAFAWSKLSGGGAQPAAALPADTIAYARIDLDPSASQKINALRLLRKVPDLARETGIKSDKDDLRRLVFSEIASDCKGLNYDRDVKPWLGDRAGIGAVGGFADDEMAIVLQAKDEKKARAAAKKVAACEGDGDTAGVAFSQGYLLLAETQKLADRWASDAAQGSLADDKTFRDDEKTLGDRGVVSLWLDAKALKKVPEVAQALAASGGADQLDKISSVSMALRAGSDSLELAGFTQAAAAPKTKPVDVGALPKGTALALGFSLGDADEYVDELQQGLEDELGMSESDVARFVDQQTGLKYPEDLRTLIGDGLTIAIGSKNLDRAILLAGPDDVASLDAGIALHGDPAKASDLLGRLADLAEQAIGLRLETARTKDGAVIATNADTAKAFSAAGDQLGSTAAYQSVVEHSSDSYGTLFLDVAAVVKALQASSPPPDVAEVLDNLGELRAVGASSWIDGDAARFSLKVAFTK